jgi:hypothetical protein
MLDAIMPDNIIFIEILKISDEYSSSISDSIDEFDGDELPYIWVGSYVADAANLFNSGNKGPMDNLIIMAEELLKNDSHYVREFATVGLIEDMQNSNLVPDNIQKYIYSNLNPLAKLTWEDVDRFWSGKLPFIPDRI